MVDVYNQQRLLLKNGEIDGLTKDETKISWSVNLKRSAENNNPLNVSSSCILSAFYRPYTKQYLAYDRGVIERPGQWVQFFPTLNHSNSSFGSS